MNQPTQIRVAAIVMFVAIGLGAMGAHALEDRLTENGFLDTWNTAALYQLVHGLALFVVSLAARNDKVRFCYWAWLVGVFLFSGSLFVLSYTGITKLGMITPLGGVAFMVGWAALLFRPRAVMAD